jgi:hypothetical protein
MYLCSDLASDITGTHIVIDGGRSGSHHRIRGADHFSAIRAVGVQPSGQRDHPVIVQSPAYHDHYPHRLLLNLLDTTAEAAVEGLRTVG